MPIINRLLINSNNDDEHYKVLVTRQTRNDKNHETARRGYHNHNNRSCMIRIFKTGKITTRNSKYITATSITGKIPWGTDKQKYNTPFE